MSFADEVRKAVKDGRINPRRSDLGLKLQPDDCEMGVCGNKKVVGNLCNKCHDRMTVALSRMIDDADPANYWKSG